MRENMKMEQLEYFGIPSYIINIWKDHYSSTLLPVQEKAVRQFNLLQYPNFWTAGAQTNTGSDNLLVISPSSSGKTLIGEMAAMQDISLNKKIIFLVPLRILAEEKYRHFLALYQSIGLKVKLSSRDHRHDDRDIIQGHFHIAVIVYEKFYYLLLQYPRFLKNISLLIADEIQLINDAQRGPRTEKMLSYLLYNNPAIRILGLSAFTENIQNLAELVNAKTLFSSYRPVELRKGIVRKGVYQYIEHNTGVKGKEIFFPEENVSECHLAAYLKSTLEYLLERNETSLVFFPTRREIRLWSRWLATQFDLPPAQNTLEELGSMEDSTSREELIVLLQKGIAYHCADLSWQERHFIETALRNGDIKIICATDTLSMGINLPVDNVILTGQKVISENLREKSTALPYHYRRALTLSEVENMGGRAGRFNQQKRFGRIIFLAPSLIELTAYQKLYFDSPVSGALSLPTHNGTQIPEQSFQIQENHSENYGQNQIALAAVNPDTPSPLYYPLPLREKPIKTEENLSNFLLQHIALNCHKHDIQDIFSFIQSGKEKEKASFWNYQFSEKPNQSELLSSLHTLGKEHLIQINNQQTCRITDLGKLVVSKGISFQTYLHFKKWLNEYPQEIINELEVLYLIANSMEGRGFFIPYPKSRLKKRQYPHSPFGQDRWKEYLRMRFLNLIFEQGQNHKPIFKINLLQDSDDDISQTPRNNPEKYLTIKKTLLMFDWINNRELREIEEEYGLLSGSIQKMGEDFSWLTETLGAIAGKIGWKEQRASDLARIFLLSERLTTGVITKELALAKLRIPGLTRGYIRSLVQEGYDSKECLQELTEKQLRPLLPERLIIQIRRYLGSKEKILNGNRKKNQIQKRKILLTESVGSKSEESKPVITINSNRPDQIFFFQKAIPVNRINFQLLLLLWENQGKILSYEEIIDTLWSDDEDATYHRLWYHLGKLRSGMVKIIKEKNVSDSPENYVKENILRVFPGRGLLLEKKVLVKIEKEK